MLAMYDDEFIDILSKESSALATDCASDITLPAFLLFFAEVLPPATLPALLEFALLMPLALLESLGTLPFL
jgi:hypothetical protein